MFKSVYYPLRKKKAYGKLEIFCFERELFSIETEKVMWWPYHASSQ